MTCNTFVRIRPRTSSPADAQNSGQFWITTAIPPMMNATMAIVVPVQAAMVRPWWTCLVGFSCWLFPNIGVLRIVGARRRVQPGVLTPPQVGGLVARLEPLDADGPARA